MNGAARRGGIVRRWSHDPRVPFDIAVAALIAVVSIIDVASNSAASVPWERSADSVAYALIITGALSLVWRRQRPVLVLGVVVVVASGFWLRGHGALLSELGLPGLYAVAVHEDRRRRAWWAMILGCVALLLSATASVLRTPDGFDYFTLVSMIAFLVGTAVFGLLVRNRERIFVDSERRAALAEADRVVEAQRAVLRERRRIAREMHDVVAHSLSVITVQAAAGAEIVRADADKAAEVFAKIEAAGRESLTELRRMLGVLRESGESDPGGGPRFPQPSIADIAALVEGSDALGPSVSLICSGQRRALPAGIELAAYRIVQEGLTNVRKHAGAATCATVRVTYEAASLVIEVIDDGHGATTSITGPGHGLVGMAERVEIYGGTLSAGPRSGGGYSVRAALPVPEPGVGAP